MLDFLPQLKYSSRMCRRACPMFLYIVCVPCVCSVCCVCCMCYVYMYVCTCGCTCRVYVSCVHMHVCVCTCRVYMCVSVCVYASWELTYCRFVFDNVSELQQLIGHLHSRDQKLSLLISSSGENLIEYDVKKTIWLGVRMVRCKNIKPQNGRDYLK